VQLFHSINVGQLDLLLLVVFAAAEGQDAQEQLHPWKVAESRL
jgi:oxalate decarboxylase/phosphoglucose isomerase-like protein (cupin superfamily)